ncbi:hypothetical protein [Streptomyces sp. NPDC046805]|uniref:hypothetical protein n=1 Tax=Streptomyces sp. NPDC046805 TaxID=3155134 RepID=UPI0033CAFB0F
MVEFDAHGHRASPAQEPEILGQTLGRRFRLVEPSLAEAEAGLLPRDVAVAFDRRLRTGLTEAEVQQFEDVLARLRNNVTPDA